MVSIRETLVSKTVVVSAFIGDTIFQGIPYGIEAERTANWSFRACYTNTLCDLKQAVNFSESVSSSVMCRGLIRKLLLNSPFQNLTSLTGSPSPRLFLSS